MSEQCSGLWRDGSLLVVDLRSHHFPHRCLKTNQHVSPDEHRLITQVVNGVPNDEVASLKGFNVASSGHPLDVSVRQYGSIVKVPLTVPLAPDWEQNRKSPTAIRIACIGIAITVLSILGQVPLMFMMMDWLMGPLGIATVVGIVMTITGFVMLTMRDQNVLPIYKVEDGKAWIKKVDVVFLESLPAFQGTRELMARQLRRATLEKWMFLGSSCCLLAIGLIGGALCIAALANARTQQRWPTVTATVSSSNATEETRYVRYRGMVTTYITNVSYEYIVDGKSITAQDSVASSDPMRARSIVAKYYSGATVVAHYNPARPEESVLEVGDASGLAFVLPFAVAAVIGGAVVWRMSRSRANRERELRSQLA